MPAQFKIYRKYLDNLQIKNCISEVLEQYSHLFAFTVDFFSRFIALCYYHSLSIIEQFQWRRASGHSFACPAVTLNSCALALAAVHRRVAAATTYCRHTNTITSLARLVGHCVWSLATTTTTSTTAFARLALRLYFSFSLALLACGRSSPRQARFVLRFRRSCDQQRRTNSPPAAAINKCPLHKSKV